MTPASVKEPIQCLSLDDVSEDPQGLRTAFDLVVQGYSPLASRTLTPEVVRRTLCNDVYHRVGLARTLLLTGSLDETGMSQPLGTVRILPSSSRAVALGISPLEAMDLMVPEEGWADFGFQGFSLDQAVEGGRIAVAAACRSELGKRRGLPEAVLRELVAGGFRTAIRKFGKSQYWGVLPDYMVKRMEALGFTILAAPRVACRSKENGQLFERFDRYWLQHNPRFCRVIVEPEGVQVI